MLTLPYNADSNNIPFEMNSLTSPQFRANVSLVSRAGFGNSCVLAMLLLLTVIIAVVAVSAEGPYTPSDNAAFYPVNSLNSAGALFPLGGDIPSSRVHHTITASSDYLFVYGGYDAYGAFLGDINLFYIPSQQWTGPIERKQCCNRRGENIETIGADNDMNFGENENFPDVSVGFEGDAPLPRAEHASCVVAENMFTFGGVTDLYGYSNDLYKFDPLAVRWSVQDASVGDTFPRRRAGHAMVCDSPNRDIYVFGGRSSFNSLSNVGLNDVWRYNTDKASWTHLTAGVEPGRAPGVRQYASLIQLNNNLYVYGGVNPASGLVYSDVWVFRVAVQQWEQLYSLRGGHTNANTIQYPTGDTAYQFAPPPLYLAHILPVPESLDPFTGINTTFYGSDADTSRLQNGGFLIYGGVGGGGNCGSRQCGAVETSLGQVYRFSLQEGTWTSPHTITGDASLDSFNDAQQEKQYVQSSAWQYARLSSAPAVTDASARTLGAAAAQLPYQGTVDADAWHDRGKWVKTFAYEKVVYHPARNVLYEMGGMIAKKRQEGVTSGAESVLVPRQQSTTLGSADVAARDAGEQLGADAHIPTGGTPIFLDMTSGNIQRDLWDRHTGERLRQVVDLPVNGFWDYTDGFNASSLREGAFKPVEFLRAFRTYTVSPSDLVLIKEDAVNYVPK